MTIRGLTVFCRCGAGHVDPGGSDERWRCRVCEAALRRSNIRVLTPKDECFVTDADGITRRLSAAVRVF